MSRTLHLTIDVAPEAWINSNHREHWAQRNRKTQVVRESMAWIGRNANHAFATPVHIHAVAHKPTMRKFDAHNLMPTVKAAIDGLVDAGVLPGDTNDDLPMVTISGKSGAAAGTLTLTITTVDPIGVAS